MVSANPILAAADPISHVLPHELFSIGPFAVTNHVLMAVVAAVLVLLAFRRLARRMRPAGEGAEAMIPKGPFTQLLEVMCVFVREEVARPNLKDLTDKYIPYLWTVFFFILFCNLLGMIPFGPLLALLAGLVGGDTTYWGHWGGTATGNLSLNLPLALVAFIMINLIGIRESGLGYFKHFNPGPWYMAPILVPLEVMGLIIKSTVLAMRLFGTMMAGHLVIAVFLSLIPLTGLMALGVGISVVVGGVALMLLELFIALLQAFIFTFLTTLFIAAGAVHEDDHEHEDDEYDVHGDAGHHPAITSSA